MLTPLRRNLRLLLGSPCLHCGNTIASSACSSQPSSWRNHQRSCTGQQEVPVPVALWGTASGNPCCALGSTKPSCLLPTTIPHPLHS